MITIELNNIPAKSEQKKEMEEIRIDYLIHDVLIIKAECLNEHKLYHYADYLEKQLMKIKNREAKLELGVPLK